MYDPFTHAEALSVRITFEDPGYGDARYYDHPWVITTYLERQFDAA